MFSIKLKINQQKTKFMVKLSVENKLHNFVKCNWKSVWEFQNVHH